jgi:hypothetical protein
VPADGSIVYVRLYTRPGPQSEWFYRDYTYIASGGQ